MFFSDKQQILVKVVPRKVTFIVLNRIVKSFFDTLHLLPDIGGQVFQTPSRSRASRNPVWPPGGHCGRPTNTF